MGRKKTNPIWEFFEHERGSEEAVCKIAECEAVVTTPNYGVAGLVMHLKTRHNAEYQEYMMMAEATKDQVKNVDANTRKLPIPVATDQRTLAEVGVVEIGQGPPGKGKTVQPKLTHENFRMTQVKDSITGLDILPLSPYLCWCHYDSILEDAYNVDVQI